MPSQRALPDFERWTRGSAGVQVYVYVAGTTTLASLYLDEALTLPAANPQVLLSLTVNNVTYGRVSQPVYTGQAVQWEVSGSRSGVIRPPLLNLSGADATDATVLAEGGTAAYALKKHLARMVYAADYGAITGSPADNTVTIAAAIGAAAARGGGAVALPAGTVPFTTLNVPVGVILVGQGRAATVLESTTNDRVITLGGDRSGLANLTLDGVVLTPNSVGIFSKGRTETRFIDVEIKRFETGMHFRGGRRAAWQDLYLTNCATGAKLHGDLAALDGGGGDEFANNTWQGGRVIQCTTIGIDLSYEDTFVRGNAFLDVGLEQNTGIALKGNGARFTQFRDCWMLGNTTDLDVRDDDNAAKRLENTVQCFQWHGGQIQGGAVNLRDTLQDVLFEGVSLRDVDFTLTTPKNAVLLRDCTEDSQVTIAGSGQYITRFQSSGDGMSTGVTTDATATKAWATGELQPGELVFLEGIALGNQRNGTNTGEYYVVVSAKRPGSTLAYDTQTSNFTLGDIVTGATSLATGRIIADADGGAAGTLTLRDIVGEFVDNEVLTGAAGGSALVNGTLTHQNAALLGSVTALRAAREDVVGWDAVFVANGPEIELRVTGAAATTIEWTTRGRRTSA